jgi:TatD-related deoxyribonuclease
LAYSRVPIADAHSHVNAAKGVGASELADRFRGSGGWFIALVSASPWDYGITIAPEEAYMKSLDIHVRACREVRERGLRVACLAGFYPGDVDRLASGGMRPSEILRLGHEVIGQEFKMCREGLLDGIGEVGRQHYKTAPLNLLVSELIMEEAIRVASDSGCIVHLHLEDVGPDTVLLTNEVIGRLNVKPSPRVVFHHARPDMVATASSLGYASTVYGREEALRAAISRGALGFMVESDFNGLSDSLVAPWTLGPLEGELLAESILTEDDMYRLNVDNIVRTYGVTPP